MTTEPRPKPKPLPDPKKLSHKEWSEQIGQWLVDNINRNAGQDAQPASKPKPKRKPKAD